MKNTFKIIFALFICLQLNAFAQDSTAQKKERQRIKTENRVRANKGFVDKNNDGYNDNAPDHDLDGIPDGLDKDFLKLRTRARVGQIPYIDLDGDGINDNLQLKVKNQEANKLQQGVKPQAGKGSASGANKGKGQQKGRNK